MRVLIRTLAALAAGLCPALLLAQEPEPPGIGEAARPVVPPTVWGILIFAAVLLILWRKAFPPITAALEKRERLIRESLEAARQAKAEAEAMMLKHEESLERARVEARAIIEQSKGDALRVKEQIIESARRESEELTQRARRDIELAKQKAIHDLQGQAIDLSLELAEKFLKRNLRAEDHDDLIRESIKKYQAV
jgi:F-type H+-transporting ATPase subunit b